MVKRCPVPLRDVPVVEDEGKQECMKEANRVLTPANYWAVGS